MKLHIISVGKPKLEYAILGFNKYLGRLRRYHDVRTSHVNDKFGNDGHKILSLAGSDAVKIGLDVSGQEFSSLELASLLDRLQVETKETAWFIGGPDGLPDYLKANCDQTISLSKLTFPHDLALLILLETLYRASSINSGSKYHH